MISPFVRRMRLARELRALREEARLTHEQLAKKVGTSRQQISRLENGHVAPGQDEVIAILDALGVSGEKWTQILAIAQDAAVKGWFESTAKAMGARQALFANLEAGASEIFEYQQNVIPGLLQTPAYTRERIEADWMQWDSEGDGDADGRLKGRAGRQRMLKRPGGPAYEAILDEVAVRRLTAPPAVLREQLLYVVAEAQTGTSTVRVLPVDARIEGYGPPVCSFSCYRFPDPGDPVVVALEAVTSDHMLTDPDQVGRYLRMQEGLRQAALTVEASLELLTQVADRLPDLQDT
jgi:transcriptional regulator with XRE-family HTH domain